MLSNPRFLPGTSGILRYKIVRLCLILLVLFGASARATRADSAKTPLYLLLKPDRSDQKTPDDSFVDYLATGDLWKWVGDPKGQLIQVSHWGFNKQPVSSPNGNYIAYQSMPQITLDYLKSDASHAAGLVIDALPFNLWILDTQTDQSKRITDQSQAAHIDFAQFDLVNGTTRSAPAWSPDSQKIAWIEADSSAATSARDPQKFVPRLMVYNLVTGKTQVMAEHLSLPDYGSPQAGGTPIGDMTPQWGKAGLVVGYLGSAERQTYAVYDLSGKLLRELTEDSEPSFPGYVWVDDGQQQYLGTKHESTKGSSGWSFYDIKTGQNVSLGGQIEGYSPLATKGITLRVSDTGNWEYVSPEQTPQEFTDCYYLDGPNYIPFAIAPDGQTVACVSLPGNVDNSVTIYDKAGAIVQLSLGKNLVFGMSWGKLGWRITQN